MVPREPLELNAIYFISNTAESVKQVVADFSKNKPQYAAAHLFFTGRMCTALCMPERVFVRTIVRRTEETNSTASRFIHNRREAGVDADDWTGVKTRQEDQNIRRAQRRLYG